MTDEIRYPETTQEWYAQQLDWILGLEEGEPISAVLVQPLIRQLLIDLSEKINEVKQLEEQNTALEQEILALKAKMKRTRRTRIVSNEQSK